VHQSPDRTKRARRLRSDLTLAESKLWNMVRDRRLDGLKFRRETPLTGLTVDFYCPELKLVIEVDGGVHRLKKAEDAGRDERLRAARFEVVRIGNEAFLTNPGVLIALVRARAERLRT
jgi:type I restriction enzyme R subunit